MSPQYILTGNMVFLYYRTIPNMKMEIEVSVMNRGLLSDEFIGYVAVPLREYDVYERPRSQ